jgi:muramoyltetrapeptide carboxypeptidase
MHNIDRQMRILQMNGVLDRCKGVVLGEFSDCGSEFTYENVEAMIRQIVEHYGIPMLCGFPAGHGDVNLPLVMGAPVTIDVRGDGATLRFNIDSRQRDITTGPAVTNTKSLSDRLRMAGKVF